MIRWLVSVLSRCWSGNILVILPFGDLLYFERNLTRKLKVHGPKINRSRKAVQGLPGELGPECFSRYEKMQEFGLIKSLPENIWLSEGQFFWVFPRAKSALFFISTLNSFQGVSKVSSLQWSWCNLYRGSWKVPTSSQQSLFIATYLTMFGEHFMALVSHGAGKAFPQI